MIGACVYVVGTQDFGELFHLLPAQAIDDARLATVVFDISDDVLVYVFGLRAYFVVQVRTVERRLELLGIDDA